MEVNTKILTRIGIKTCRCVCVCERERDGISFFLSFLHKHEMMLFYRNVVIQPMKHVGGTGRRGPQDKGGKENRKPCRKKVREGAGQGKENMDKRGSLCL